MNQVSQVKRWSASHTLLDLSGRQLPFAAQIGSRLGLDGLKDLNKLERFIAEPFAVLDLRINGEDKPEPEVGLIGFLEDYPNLVQEI